MTDDEHKPGTLPAFTPTQAKAAREWVAECADCGSFRDADADYILTEATDEQCVRCVIRTYAGGWAQFCRDMEPLTTPAPVAMREQDEDLYCDASGACFSDAEGGL